ncbi:nuclear transport factor 2 family protein [Planctobacterium marinum]|uniref:nuclear transport factor 2 family protein n=1 Tax=Planctobacterium marinum TaxID=1631968 RepID=UPI001E4F6B17|nr:nuclear transport factor 2 family protein [Planctobacterium marinum]MCC2605643.1 nuclear transport factor 2 family protein [Planctobacterium marinum]
MSVLDNFTDFYKDLRTDKLEQLQTIYHPDIIFTDPVGSHVGLVTVHEYFKHLLETTRRCEFHIQHITNATDFAFVRWVMILEHPKLAGGNEIKLDGVSELKIDNNLIVAQTDFYDMGAMFYEHIPVLKNLVRFVKNKIKNYKA